MYTFELKSAGAEFILVFIFLEFRYSTIPLNYQLQNIQIWKLLLEWKTLNTWKIIENEKPRKKLFC